MPTFEELIEALDQRQAAVVAVRARVESVQADKGHLQSLMAGLQQHATQLESSYAAIPSEALATSLTRVETGSGNLVERGESSHEQVVSGARSALSSADESHAELSESGIALGESLSSLRDEHQTGSDNAATHSLECNQIQDQSTRDIGAAGDRIGGFHQENHDHIVTFHQAVTDSHHPSLIEHMSSFKEEVGVRQASLLQAGAQQFVGGTHATHQMFAALIKEQSQRLQLDGSDLLETVAEHISGAAAELIREAFSELIENTAVEIAEEVAENVILMQFGASTTTAMAPILPEIIVAKKIVETVKGALDLII